MKTVFILTIIFFGTTIASPRDEAVLFDQFESITCEDLMARTEALGWSLTRSPSASAVVVGHNLKKGGLHLQPVFMHRRLIGIFGNAIGVRFFSFEDEGKPRTDVWLIPPGTDFNSDKFKLNLSIPFQPTSRVLIGSSAFDSDACSDRAFGAFIQLLKTTKLSGQIVLINQRRQARNRSIAAYRGQLQSAGVPNSRIRFRYRTVPKLKNELHDYDEFWLNP